MKIDNLSTPPVQGQMNRHRWETVNRIFHAALEIESCEREVFVRSASESDPEIYVEVMALLRADENVGSYMETPLLQDNLSAIFESPLKPEDVLCERFRILRAIAEGGMGHVFEALDTELNVRVALKVIRPEIASVPEALARFRQEVRLARTITHPNVCRTFDIDRETRILEPETGSQLDLVFLTMELLPGETLASRIKRNGALSIEEALSLACQIADALHAAHALGIVHRDIKPSNIILVPTDGAATECQVRAVITDFGLARLNPVLAVANASSLSHTAHPIGTLAYMAPEQLGGAPVSPATDIYAFGLILFEMVTGTKAFPSDNLLTGLSQRLTGPPPSPKPLAPHLPDDWCHAIDRCLQVHASERPQDAREVAALLRGERSHRTSGRGRFYLGISFLFGSFRRTIAVFVTTVCICVALFAAGFRLYQSRADSHVTPGAMVYLAPIQNETGENKFDNLTELVQAGLAQSTQINLLDPGRTGDILQLMTKSPDTKIDGPLAREIALRSGAARVVLVTIKRSTGDYSLNVDVQQPDAGNPKRSRNHWSKDFNWHSLKTTSGAIPQELLSTLRNASDWIRNQVGESKDDIARLDVPPENVTTGDWQALTDYEQAQRSLRRGRKDDAITLLKNAVLRDPGFALAYAELADNIASTGSTKESYNYYISALNDDSGQRLSRKERDFIRGDFAADSRDYSAALEAFRDSSAFYEKDFLSWFKQAYPLEKLNRPADALRVLERADALSTTHDALGEMAFPYLLAGDYDSAKRSINAFRAAGHIDHATLIEGVEEVCEGKYIQANESFNQLQKSADHELVIVALLDRTRLLSEQGRYTEALKITIDGFDTVSGFAPIEVKAELWLDRGYLDMRMGNQSRGLSDISEALQISTEPNTILMASTIVGSALPRLDESDKRYAQKMLDKMERSIPTNNQQLMFELARLQTHGEVLLSRNDARGAVESFRAADQLDAPVGPREYLARGLVASAVKESNPARAFALREEALRLYAKVALNPVAVWLDANALPPGFVADQMTEYLTVARTLNKVDLTNDRVSAALHGLRGELPVASHHYTIKGGIPPAVPN